MKIQLHDDSVYMFPFSMDSVYVNKKLSFTQKRIYSNFFLTRIVNLRAQKRDLNAYMGMALLWFV